MASSERVSDQRTSWFKDPSNLFILVWTALPVMVVVAVVVVVFSVAKRKDTIPSSARDKHVVVAAIAILAVLVLGRLFLAFFLLLC